MDSSHLVGTLAWNSEIYTDSDPRLRYEGSLKTLYSTQGGSDDTQILVFEGYFAN